MTRASQTGPFARNRVAHAPRTPPSSSPGLSSYRESGIAIASHPLVILRRTPRGEAEAARGFRIADVLQSLDLSPGNNNSTRAERKRASCPDLVPTCTFSLSVEVRPMENTTPHGLSDGPDGIAGAKQVDGANQAVPDRGEERSAPGMQHWYGDLVELAGLGIWVFSAEGGTTYVNRPMAEMLGYTVEQMMRLPISVFGDDDAFAMAEIYHQCRRQGLTEVHEFRLLHRDGSDVFVYISATPIFDRNKKFCGAVAMLMNITGQKRIEAERDKNEERYRRILDQLVVHAVERRARLREPSRTRRDGAHRGPGLHHQRPADDGWRVRVHGLGEHRIHGVRLHPCRRARQW